MTIITKHERGRLYCGLGLIAIAALVQYCAGSGGDKIWLLVLSQMWLSGKALYTTLFQPNLPMITWFYALPVKLSQLTGWVDYHLLTLLTLLVAAISSMLCFKLMRKHPQFAGNAYKQRLHALLLGFIYIVWTNPAFFGDREHLIVLCMFPYILRSMPSLSSVQISRGLSVEISVMAAIGICIRPQTLLLFAAIQLLNMREKRSWRILTSFENLIIYGCGVIYLLLILGFTTDYFRVVLPMVAATYAETNQGVTRFLPYCTSLFMLGVTLAEFRLRHTSPYRRDILYFLGLIAACFLYAVSNNGWLYTFYPLQSLILFTTAWVLWEFAWLAQTAGERGEPVRSFAFGVKACAANLMFNTALVFIIYSTVMLPQSYQDKLAPKPVITAELMQLIADNHIRSFGMISSSRSVWPEIIYYGHASMETRFNHIWMFTKFFSSDEVFAQKYKWIRDYVAKAYVEDLNTNKPEILIIDAADEFYYTGKKVDLVAYFSVYPEFAAAWGHYKIFKVIDHCNDPAIQGRIHKGLCRYDVYQRKD